MEYFAYKKLKKHQAEKNGQTQVRTPSPSTPRPILNEEDENFLERIVSAEGTPPPLPNRPEGWVAGVGMEAGDSRGNKSQMVVHDGNDGTTKEQHHKQDKGKGKENRLLTGEHKPSRFAALARSLTKKHKDGVHAQSTVPSNEGTKEEDDINRVLDDLNLAAVNNRAFSMSKESQILVQKFTVILKDLINGVPTAYDDLTHLLDDSQGTLSKSYDSLPTFLKKLVAQLPDKMSKNLAPELLAVASEAAALGGKGGAGGGLKSMFTPTSLKDLVAKPGAIVSLLKTIMNALKLRWPAFMGTNVLLSLGLFVLLFVFWYCHKRGRETRLEREAKVDSQGRIIELDDDPMLESGPGRPGASRSRTDTETEHRHRPSSSRVQSERPHHEKRTSRSAELEREDRERGSRPHSSRKRSEENGGARRRRSDDYVAAGDSRRDDKR